MLHTAPTNRAIAWGLLAIAVVVNIAGYLFNLYDRLWWFDEVLHGYTIGAITLVLGLALYGTVLTGVDARPVLLVLVIAAVGLAVGALWEVGEWAYDQVVAGNAIKGKRDTILDMIMDTFGALAAGVAAVPMVNDQQPDD